VLEVMARVEPFENGRGFTLRVLYAKKPRDKNRRGSVANLFDPNGRLQTN
jgi:hypothetical protein